MKLPESNIELTAVRDVLEATDGILSELCTHASLNMWSKYKPIRVAGNPVLWWSSDNCGYTIPDWDGTEQSWTYRKPLGGEASPYRLGDFRGYYHDAPPIIRITNHDGSTFSTQSAGGKLIFPFLLTMEDDDSMLELSDIGSLSGYYLACQVSNGTSTVWGVSIDNQIIIDFRDFGMPFSLPGWQNKTLTFKFFLSSAAKGFADSDISHTRKAIHHVAGECETTQEVYITNSVVVDFDIEVIGVRQNLSSGSWITIDDMGLVIDEDAIYTAGPLALRCLLKGSGAISGTGYNINLYPTYFNTTYNVQMTAVMYDTSYNAISSVTASSVGTEFILYDNFLNRNGSIIQVQEDDTDVVSSFNFRHNTTTLAQLTKPFRNYTP